MDSMLSGMDFAPIRTALKRERKARVGSRAKMEELSGVPMGTIYKIETGWVDPRTGRPYGPSAEHLLRLIEALPGLTLTAFFALVEGVPETGASETDTVEAQMRAEIQRVVRSFEARLGLAPGSLLPPAPTQEADTKDPETPHHSRARRRAGGR